MSVASLVEDPVAPSVRPSRKKSATGAAIAGAAAGGVVLGPIGAVAGALAAGTTAASNDRKAGHLAREIGDKTMCGVEAGVSAGKAAGQAAGRAGKSAGQAIGRAGKTAGRIAGKAAKELSVPLRSAALGTLKQLQRFDRKVKFSATVSHAALSTVSYVLDRPDEAFLSAQTGWFVLELAGTNLRLDVRHGQLMRGADLILWTPTSEEEFDPARHQVWRYDVSSCLAENELRELSLVSFAT